MIALLLSLQAAAVTAPPRPPMPMIVDCLPGPWIVFFPRNSAALDREAVSILDNVLRVEREGCGGATYTLAGHTDRGERSGVDRRRALAVRSYLARGHVPRIQLSLRTLDAGTPRIARPGAERERQNQRVEITAGPPGYSR